MDLVYIMSAGLAHVDVRLGVPGHGWASGSYNRYDSEASFDKLMATLKQEFADHLHCLGHIKDKAEILDVVPRQLGSSHWPDTQKNIILLNDVLVKAESGRTAEETPG